MSSFDISTAIEVAETTDVEIFMPGTEEPLAGEGGQPCSVTVYTPGTRQYAAAQTRSSNRAMKRFRAKGKAEATPEEDAAHKAAFLADITVSLNNFTFGGGDPRSRDTFVKLYSDPRMGFIADRVNGEAGDWGNAIKTSPNS